MVKTIEVTGKNTEEAVKVALEQLGATRDEVTIEEIQKAKSGFFGLGSSEAIIRVTYNATPTDHAVSFLEGLLTRMGVTATVEALPAEEGTVKLNISGENMGVVIGRRGDTLDALQYITSIAVNRGEPNHIKVTIDTENYRMKREETLINLANKVAGRVLKYRKNVTLEPMSSYERRVIHSTLQDVQGVSTYSTGSDPNRRVVVAFGNRNNVVRGRQTRSTTAPIDKDVVDETV